MGRALWELRKDAVRAGDEEPVFPSNAGTMPDPDFFDDLVAAREAAFGEALDQALDAEVLDRSWTESG